jgi:quercetin dioxygenase-like cupin family protein
MSKLLQDFPGKEVVIITGTYPPGRSGAVHRHSAHGFIYVLVTTIILFLALQPASVKAQGAN